MTVAVLDACAHPPARDVEAHVRSVLDSRLNEWGASLDSQLYDEEVTQVPAFLSMLPGSSGYQLRKKGCTSRNAGDFLPVFAPWRGCSRAMSLLSTPTGEAFKLDLFDKSLAASHHGLVAAALSHEWAIAVRHGCFCANPYVFHLLHMNRDDVAEVEGEVTAGRRKALPGAVRASLAPYNTEAEVDRFLEAVRQVARGRIKATYEQAADGTYSPAGGWPRITSPLHAVVKH